MRALIVGASGFVGSALQAVFGGQAVGTYCTHPVEGLRPLDMRDRAAVERLIAEVRPEVVLQPAAQPHVDWCEQHAQASYAINVAGTRNVAEAAAAAGARYLFVSTDYVFDGTAGPYAEDAPTAPRNVYGRHKLEAEELIASALQNYVIVRVCGVYGYEPQGKNFVMALLAKGRRGEAMNVPSDQWGTPTYGENLAAAMHELALGTARGVYHVVGPDWLDRVSFARLACEVFDLDPGFLRPRTTAELAQPAPRPLRGGLQSAKARALLTTELLPPRRGLELMKQRLRDQGQLV